MNSRNVLNVDKSAFISLQAELARKKEEVRNKTQNASRKPSKLDFKNSVKEPPTTKSKPGKEAVVIEEIEDSVLQYSHDALVAKSKLYDKLRSKELITDDSEKFLVDFDSKQTVKDEKDESNDSFSDQNSDPESDWVEYVDGVGRTRTCLRKDLPYYQELSEDLQQKDKPPEPPEPVNFVKQSEELLIWDKKREELRQKWDEEDKILSTKRDIHYQDVLFGEARSHGVGFYNFSHDETERQKQQEELKKMREETEKSQRLTMSIKERRELQMKQRLEAAKRRKRERLGLPPEAELEEDKVKELYEFDEPAQDKSEEKEEKDEMSKTIEEYLANVKRSAHIRPWDVGKAGMQAPVMTQEQWNEKQRLKRKKDFAPPSSYQKDSIQVPEEDNSSGLYFTSKKPRISKDKLPEKGVPIKFEYSFDEEEASTSQPRGQGTEIPPPQSYEKSKAPKPKKLEMSDAIEAGLNYLRNEAEKKTAKKLRACFEV